MKAASPVRRIDLALRSFFKPQYGSPESLPSAQEVIDAMTGCSQGFQVVIRYAGLVYCTRTPAGDPFRRYRTFFRFESFRSLLPKTTLTLSCFRRLVNVMPPKEGLSLKFERIVEYKESLTGAEGSCSGSSLIMQFSYSRTDNEYMECRVQMLDYLLETNRNSKSALLKSAFSPFCACDHTTREAVYKFSFLHNKPE